MTSPEQELERIFQALPESIRSPAIKDASEILELKGVREKAVQGFGDKYAYLWSDLISLDDLVSALSGLFSGKSAEVAAIKDLLSIWKKHRSTRVRLSADEAAVLLFVRKQPVNYEQIVGELTNKVEGPLQATINQLLAKTDPLGRKVLQDRDGTFSTIF